MFLLFAVFLFISAIASPKLITPFGEDKIVTEIEIQTHYLGGDEYNFTVTLYEVHENIASTKEETSAIIGGKMVATNIALIPLPSKTVVLTVGEEEFSKITNEYGQYSVKVNISKVVTSNTFGCAEVEAQFNGHDPYKASKSNAGSVCASTAKNLAEPVAKVAEETMSDGDKANVCMMFFVFIGFLIAGLYASGTDPFRLLDITTPRLPAARRKPEIRLKIEEDKLRGMRKWTKHAKTELNDLIDKSAKQIAESAAKKNKNNEESSGNKEESAAMKDKNKKEIRRELNDGIENIKRQFKEILRSRTANVDTIRAIAIERDLTLNMYEKIGNFLYSKAREIASDDIARDIAKIWVKMPAPSNKFKEKLPRGLEMAKLFAQMQHASDLIHMRQKGLTDAKGTISEWRRTTQMIPIVGYAVNVADNIRGFVYAPIKYYKKRKEIRTAENELKEIERKREEHISGAVGKVLTVDERKKIEELDNEYIQKLMKLREKKTEPLLPDIVKSNVEAYLYSTNLMREVVNAANHLLLREIERQINNKDVFDRFYGKVVAERDLFKRYEMIRNKAKSLELENTDAMKEANNLVDTINIYRNDVLEKAEDIIEIARKLSQNPERYGLLVVEQNDEVRRYIELGEFIEEEVLEKCRNEGFTAGMRYFKEKSGIEDYDKIRETHAEFVEYGGRYSERLEDIKNDPEMFYFLLHSRVFSRLIEYLDSRGILPSTMDRRQFERLSRYFARELAYIDSITGSVIMQDEAERRKSTVRERTLNSLVEVLTENGAQVTEKVAGDIAKTLDHINEDANSQDNISKLQKDIAKGNLMEEAIVEWAKMRALDRMIGVTKPSGLEQDIVYLANKSESEKDAYNEMMLRGIEYNNTGVHRWGILKINNELRIVNDIDQTALLADESEINSVLYPALMGLFKSEASKTKERKYLYATRTVNGREEVTVGDVVNPTERDVTALLRVFNEAFNEEERTQMWSQLEERIKNVLEGQGKGNEPVRKYLNYYRAQEVLVRMDKDVKSVLMPALMRFFKMVKEGKKSGYNDCGGIAYEDLYVEKVINGVKHVAVKGFVDPTENEVNALLRIVTKELAHKREQLVKEVMDELESRRTDIGENERKSMAQNYLGFYGRLEGFGVLYPALSLSYEAGEKFPWIQEAKGNYRAIGKERPYETMGPADQLVNYMVERKETGERVLKRRADKNWLRSFYDWLAIQAGSFIGGQYIGTMAEAAASVVVYTRHAEFIKRGVSGYTGMLSSINDIEDLSKNVLKNEGLAKKLLDIYKWRVVQEKEHEMKDEDFSALKESINPKKLLNDLIAEAEKTKEEYEIQLGRITDDKKSMVPGDPHYERLSRIETEINTEINGLKNAINSVNKANLDFWEDTDRVIEAFSDHVGSYLMMEGLNDMNTKSRYWFEQYRQQLNACEEDKKLIEGKVKEVVEDIRGVLNELPNYADEHDTLEKMGERIDKIAGEIKSVYALLGNAKNALQQYQNELANAGRDTTDVRREKNHIGKLLGEIDNAETLLNNGINEISSLSSQLSTQADNKKTLIDSTEDINPENILERFGNILERFGNIRESLGDGGAVITPLTNAHNNLQNTVSTLEKVVNGLNNIASALSKINDKRVQNAMETIKNVSSKLENSRGAIGRESAAFADIEGRIKSEYRPSLNAVKEMLAVDIRPKVVSLNNRYKDLKEMEKRLDADMKISLLVSRPTKFSWLKRTKYFTEFVKSLFHYNKAKAAEYDSHITPSGIATPKNDLVKEVFEYSNKVKQAGAQRSELEKIVDARMRNMAFIVDKFLDYAQAQYSSMRAGMHGRVGAFGLDISGIAGFQFSGPIASSLIQSMGTYGKYANKGWFTAVLLSYPIMKAQQMYKRRYAMLMKFSNIPAVYAPMGKGQDSISLLQAYLYTMFKNKVARMGESLRATAAGLPPRTYFPYLLTANPYGEVRMSEFMEIMFGGLVGFKSTPRGPRDIINYELYKPNDLVMDFKDMIYTMKEGRSMKKTPEHLMDVGIYGSAANTKFIAGREIEYFPSALGTGATMYPQRTFNMFNYNPHLSLPGMRYTAYGDIYRRTQKPVTVATEMIQLTALSKREHLLPMVFMPSVMLAATGMWPPLAMLMVYGYRRGLFGFAKKSWYFAKEHIHPETDMWIRRRIERRLMSGMYFGGEGSYIE